MGENKGQNRTIRINDSVLVLLAIILVLILGAAVYIVPRYGKVFTAYFDQKEIYNTASAELKAAQDENASLTQQLEEFKTLTADLETTRADVFKQAAQLEKDILDGKSNKKICYITIDDGPYKRGNDYLELFNKYDIKATFFLTTTNGDKLPDQADISARSMYPEYVKYGHTIGNHTYSHDYGSGGIYSSAKAFMKSVNKQQDFTKEATGGYVPEIVRFPGGTSMAGNQLGAIQDELRKEGLGWIDWTIDSGDSWGADKATPELIKKNVMDAAKDQKIMVILFHEWSKNSVDSLPEIIEYLDKEGFVFLPLFKDSVMVSK